MLRHPAPSAFSLAAVAGCALILASCASGAKQGPATSTNAGVGSVAPSIHSLERLAESDSRRAQQRDIPPPPGLDATIVAPLSVVPPEAKTSLTDVLVQLSNELGAADSPPALSPASPENAERALRLYARARLAWTGGSNADAISLLDLAEAADPSRPEIPLLRGDILASSGQRAGSLAAYQRAIDLGRAEPRAFLLLGIASAEQGDHARAGRFLAKAITSQAAGEDPALPVIARAALGASLHNLGHLVAGNEALESAARSPLQFTSTTNYRADLQTLARRRSDLAREAGDAWARLGDLDCALEAYELAAQNPSFDPSAITERRVYVLARAGRVAEAALVLLDDVAQSSLRVDDRQLSLFQYLSENTDRGPLIARALAELPAAAGVRASALGLPPPLITPAVQGRLARATAAIDKAAGEQALREHLLRVPSDAEVARAWLELIAADRLRVSSIEIVKRQPLVAPTLGTCLASSTRWRDLLGSDIASVEATDASESLLIAALLAAQGEYAKASLSLDRILSSPGDGTPSAAALIAAQCGDWRRADSLLPAVTDPAERADVLLALQRPDQARAALQSRLSASTDVEHLRLGSDIALSLRDAEGAALLLRRAIEADPFEESLYERLAGLYRAGAPLANQDRLFEVYRDLRLAVPSSRLLRAMNAQDAAQRGLLPQAEAELVSLLETNPDDELVARLCVAVWQRRQRDDPASFSRAEATLRSLRDVRPASPVLAISLATIVAESGRLSEAETILRDQVTAAPSPLIDAALESFLRDRASRAAEADALTILRLEPWPRPIDATIELARTKARADDLGSAARILESDLPDAATLTPAQGAMLQLILADVAPGVSASPDAERTDALLRIIDVTLSRSVAVTSGVHELRIALLASKPEVDADRLIAACRDAALRDGAEETRPFKRAIASLAQSERHADALRVAIAGLDISTEPDPELALMGVRLVVLGGTAADLERVLDHVNDLATARTVLEPIHPDASNALERDATIENARGEIAFIVGNYFASSDDRKDRADDSYRLAIRYDPTHAMAANNLGYTLLERRQNLDEAEMLLELAYRHAPDDANVLDSIGWLRYQRGELNDTTAENGSIREGAITLLLKALIVDLDGGSPVTLDHYADALWMSGEKQEAVIRWEEAVTELEREAASLESFGRTDPSHAPLMASLLAKIAAANEGREPAVAPMLRSPLSDAAPAPAQDPATKLHETAPVGNASNLQPR